MSERVCKACGAALVRRPGEQSSNYRKRNTCGRSCRVALSWLSGKRTPETTAKIAIPERRCVCCGVKLERRPQEQRTNFRKRTTCSKECQFKARTKQSTGKVCDVCGSTYSRRLGQGLKSYLASRACSHQCGNILSGQIAGDAQKARSENTALPTCAICGAPVLQREGEAKWETRRRKTCSLECRYKLNGLSRRGKKRRVLSAKDRKYPLEWKAIREQVRERDGHCCQICGATPGRRTLAVHHIDYIKRNLHPSNLITLCNYCHGKTNHDRAYWQAYFTTIMAERDDVEIAA